MTAGGWSVLLGVGVTGFLFARLGLDGFGLWALAQSMSMVAGWTSLLVVGPAIAATREVARRGETSGPLDLTGCTVVVALGLLGAAVFTAAGPRTIPALVAATDPEVHTTLRQVLAWFGLQLAGEALLAGVLPALEGRQRLDLARLVDALRRTVSLGAGCAAAAGTGDVVAVQSAQSAATLGFAVVVVAVLSRRTSATVRMADAGSFLRSAAGPTMINASGVVHRSMDRLLAAAVLGPGAVALVEVATRVIDAVRLVLSTSSHATMSAAPWLQQRGEDQAIAGLARSATRFTVATTLIVAASVVAARVPLIEAWTDASTANAVSIAVVLGIGQLVLMAPLQVGVNVLVGTGRERRLVWSGWFAVLVNLGLSALLVRRLGIEGLFLATLLSSTIVIAGIGREVHGVLGAPCMRAAVPAAARVLSPGAAALAIGRIGSGSIDAGPLAEGLWTAATAGIAGVAVAVLLLVPHERALATSLRVDRR